MHEQENKYKQESLSFKETYVIKAESRYIYLSTSPFCPKLSYDRVRLMYVSLSYLFDFCL